MFDKKKSHPEFKHELGLPAKDNITGFKGIIVCRSQWQYQCNTYGLQSTTLKDGKPLDRQHFDEEQITILTEEKEAKTGDRTTGGPEKPIPQTNRF